LPNSPCKNDRALIGSQLRTFQLAQDEHCTLSLSPKEGLKNAKCPKFEQQAVITFKWYEIGCQLVLIANRKWKSHTGFRWYWPRWPQWPLMAW